MSFFIVVYSVNEVEYIWNKSLKENKAINVAKDIQMSQFDLLDTEENSTNLVLNRSIFFIFKLIEKTLLISPL